jgi:hypothetical protein
MDGWMGEREKRELSDVEQNKLPNDLYNSDVSSAERRDDWKKEEEDVVVGFKSPQSSKCDLSVCVCKVFKSVVAFAAM